VFVLHRVRSPVGRKLHHVGLADQAQLVTEHGQGTLHPQAGSQLHAGLVGAGVHGLPPQGENVVLEGLFQVNQCALPWAIGPMLERRKGDGIIGRIHVGFVIHKIRLASWGFGASIDPPELQGAQS